jgi:hypothetical protein
MQGLYQWLSGRASFFRFIRAGQSTSSTVSTETTVRREGVTLLVGSAAALDLDVCPFCGSKVARTHSEPAKRQPFGEAISQKSGQVNGRLSE